MKGQERKKEIVKIAYKLFLIKGYDNTFVDDIIAESKIAKGTFYYHFESKEELLEAVINMIIDESTKGAEAVLSMPLSVPQKIVGIIKALQPNLDEMELAEVLHRSDNIVMHEKIENRINNAAIPILSAAIEEGIHEGLFHCDYIEERVQSILSISNRLLDQGNFCREAECQIIPCCYRDGGCH
ncbi:MAG: TetR/AcrR family transcriptional regulator [Lachnospiraceae bacterium]|nr:TetR/AcrR family transcriptional regulator [Lachnospiraceae bacterium]